MHAQSRPKILLLDDDQALLDLYKEMLSSLSGQPEIHTAQTGARALALLAAEPFSLLICDLKMPKMDGLQVLSLVRRKYPQLRTVVLTAVADEQFRSRVYALGVDLFWQKPATAEETRMFLECLESLLERDNQTGFRGVQSKSLMDLIQMECLSHNSTVLKITNGPLVGKIWIDAGTVIDAEADGERGEAAFTKILGWRSGAFENFPAEPGRPRTIQKSYNALLLEVAQQFDEARVAGPPAESPSPLAELTRLTEDAEFMLSLPAGETTFAAYGLENPDQLAAWVRQTTEAFRNFGDQLKLGPLEHVEGLSSAGNLGVATVRDTTVCAGWRHNLSAAQVRERMKKLIATWPG